MCGGIRVRGGIITISSHVRADGWVFVYGAGGSLREIRPDGVTCLGRMLPEPFYRAL